MPSVGPLLFTLCRHAAAHRAFASRPSPVKQSCQKLPPPLRFSSRSRPENVVPANLSAASRCDLRSRLSLSASLVASATQAGTKRPPVFVPVHVRPGRRRRHVLPREHPAGVHSPAPFSPWPLFPRFAVALQSVPARMYGEEGGSGPCCAGDCFPEPLHFCAGVIGDTPPYFHRRAETADGFSLHPAYTGRPSPCRGRRFAAVHSAGEGIFSIRHFALLRHASAEGGSRP